ncbi:MAG TPA: serine/threonine-protein kinase, partial [Pyrinomonadaceae bacterium]
MAECIACGADVSRDEHFCGNCGTQQLPIDSELKTIAADLSEDLGVHPDVATDVAAPPEVSEAVVTGEPKPISSNSLGGSFTDNVGINETNAAPRGTGGKRPTVKQLESNTILNHRYEIVRRIGGGGMGAVYLAKDRNLGDAPRAVKEMVESHLDPGQHEKAIGDFKRESLLLTSLEHPSIPTIYDYFYDDILGRFYLVMKYISGGDLASRMRAAVAGKIDEKTVTDWGMQVADVLDYLHSRPKPIIYRDLKPANLMIDGNTGRIMLID